MRDYSRTEICNTIDEWILNEKYRAILKRKLCDAIPYERLAEEFDMSTRQVKDIVRDGRKKVFAHIE